MSQGELIGVLRLASSSAYAMVYAIDECSISNFAAGCCKIGG
jgi:hypothetical protein